MATTWGGATPQEIIAPSVGNDARIRLFLADAANPTVGKAGVTYGSVTVTYCRPGESSFSAFPTFDADNWAGLGGGWYSLIIRQSDAAELALLSVAGDLLVSIAATGCITAQVIRRVVPADAVRDDTLTDARAAKLDNLDAAVSGRAVPGDAMTLTAGERTSVGTAVWATTTRTLTSLSALTASIAAAVWAYATRVITSFAPALAQLTSRQLTAAMGGGSGTAITVPYGDTTPLPFVVYDADGNAQNLSGYTLHFGIFDDARASSWDDEAVLAWSSEAGGGITITDESAGTAELDWAQFTEAEIAALTPGTRCALLWLVSATQRSRPTRWTWTTEAGPYPI